jgi:hypothetical protein
MQTRVALFRYGGVLLLIGLLDKDWHFSGLFFDFKHD